MTVETTASDQLVLVVDDDGPVAEVMAAALEDGGFAVKIASSDSEALSLVANSDLKFVAVVTDVNLAKPGAGWEVARRVREFYPTMPVVYVTGDSEHEWAAQGVPGSAFLSKPFAVVQLVVAVATLLNSVATG